MPDTAGQDIEAHGADVRLLIDRVRAFFNSAKRGAPLASGGQIKSGCDQFNRSLPQLCERLKIEAHALEFKHFVWLATDYVAANGQS